MNTKEKFRKSAFTIFSWITCFCVYCGLLLIESLYYGGDKYVSSSTLYTGLGLLVFGAVLFVVTKRTDYMSFIGCTATQIMFVIVGTYLHELDFYFYLMILLVCNVAMSKRVKTLAVYLGLNIFIDLLVMIFLIPRLDWVNHYRFFMQFAMFLCGSVFTFAQTFNVARKETRAEQAFSSFSSLLRNTPNYMVITDAESRVRYISQKMAEFAHFTKQEFAVGQPLIDLFTDKALKLMFADILDADGFVETVMTINTGKGERHFKVIADKFSGGVDGLFIDISDITPTVQSQQRAERAQARAEAANESKTRFLANMSHEIRTPMNAIIGITEMELEREEILPETQDGLQKIYMSGHTLLGIINDILDLSKIETGKLELTPAKYHVAAMINDAVRLNAMSVGDKPIEFILNVPADLPAKLIGDELRVKQIMNNLLSNAFKYTDSGTVTLAVSTVAADAPQSDYIWLVIAVRDTGQGMTAEQVDQVFDEYSRFNAEANHLTEGTGLGMNITQNLVHMMDGKIKIESTPSIGTDFVVTIKQEKMADGGVIGRELAENLMNFRYSSSKHLKKTHIEREYMPYGSVLVVDDIETNLFVAKNLLAPYGLKIDTASSGFEAVDAVRGGAVYDVVFMDHMMPQMDGIETVRLMREDGYAHPIVALTANAVAGQSEIFRTNGFDDFISKPIGIRQMNAVLNKFIRDKQPPEVIERARSEKPEMLKSDLNAVPEILEIFARDAEKALPVLESTLLSIELDVLEDDELRLFTTTVHAMKSALANIGETKSSGLAAVLEKAGKAGDKELVSTHTDSLVKALKELIEDIGSKANGTADTADIEEDRVFLAEQLSIVKAACENYADAAAYTALDLLNTKPWKPETAAALKQIHELLFLHSDFEEAGNYAQRLLVLLRGEG